ncbi:MAG: hypothetical protein NVSMB26_25210 [Beijerinckiaceae bacterium]
MTPAILIVDDEPLVRDFVADILSEAGMTTLQAGNGDEALEVLRKKAVKVAVLLTDVRMPGELDGLDLAHVAQKSWPWIKVVLMSAVDISRAPDKLPRDARFLSKPWRHQEMTNSIRDAVSDFQKVQTCATLH